MSAAVEVNNRHEELTPLLWLDLAGRRDLFAKLLHLVRTRRITCLEYDGEVNKRDTRAMER